MKNFLRALRCAWPYRRRIALSIACAMLAALTWGLNFTAIYPFLRILGNEQNLQDWVDEKITKLQTEKTPLEKEIRRTTQYIQELEGQPPSKFRDRMLVDTYNSLAKHENRLNPICTDLYRYQWLRSIVYRFVPPDRFQTVAWVIGMVVLAVAVKGFFEFCQEALVGSVVNWTLFDIRNKFYRNAIHLDINQFGEDGTHELMARFTNDMEMLGNGLKTLFGKVIAEPLRAFSCILIASWISWQLTLMFLVLVPMAVFVLNKVGRIMKRATRRLLERMSNIYKILQETFRSIRVVKAFTMEPYERRRFRVATRDYCHKAMMVVNIDAAADPIIELLGVGAGALALLAGAYLVLQHETRLFGMRMSMQPLDAESLIQLYVLLAAIADPVRKLSSVYTKLQSGAAAADRVFQYLDRQPRVRGNSYSERLPRHVHSIEFRDICFSYEPGRPIVTNVHLDVQHGETLAIVGKNGSGKTSLLGLIPRFYDPDHGSILIDGVDIRSINLRSLRRQVGLVTQETFLFDDTIYNNIRYSNRKATRDQVEAAAQQAYAHEFIVTLAEGYDTKLGEAGSKLSGGQRQRLALARAILRDPSILILDECTSQADAESEMLIHRALREFMKGRTTFVITHRLNTLEIADRIVVLNNGRIEAVGTHSELLKGCGTYQRLHEAQFQRPAA